MDTISAEREVKAVKGKLQLFLKESLAKASAKTLEVMAFQLMC